MLDIQQISKTFNSGTIQEVRALKSVSVNIEEGSFVIVIGTNGSGKSTLQNAVSGAFYPDSGSINLAGYDITNWPEHKRARLIGRVFQNPFSGTAPHMTIAENLALATSRGKRRGLGLCLKKRVMDDFKSRIETLGMGLENRLNNSIGTLSGGQRQALTLLMATWLKPQLLLLDEHTAALDPKAADAVIQLTHKIVTEENITTLMVTHSMQQAASLGDRLIMMHGGEKIYDFSGNEKQRLGAHDLLHKFEELRRLEFLNESAAELLQACYV